MPAIARSLSLATAVVASVPASLLAQNISPNWFRSPAISPDGQTILFTHGGDIYAVAASGGRAMPLTVVESYETRPVWSHDGQHIAFASDRNGNFDVYIMPATGGQATRLTWHDADDLPSDFTVDNSAVIFESSRTDDVESVLFPSGVLAELYQVSVTGGTPEMLLTTPALNADFDSDGDRLLYEDRKGYEDELRKHHTSSIARDIWLYDASTGEHTQLTSHEAEDRNPRWSQNEDAVYFLSERNGDFNVFRMPLRADADAEQLTDFEHHPVRDLTVSPGGAMAFSWHGDIYRMTPGAAPTRLDITIGVDTGGDEPTGASESSGATEFAVAPTGKEIAFVVRGDIFVTSVDFATTRRITSTPEQERSVDFAPDGRSIVYAGERDGSWNVYEATLTDENELYFFSATAIEEKALVATDAEEFQPAYSPDGKKVAYLHNRSALNVLTRESGDIVNAMPGTWFYSYSDGDFAYDWSPDSEWLAVHFYDRGRVFVTEVGVVPADGSNTTPVNLSNTGYNAGGPVWAMEGGAILWGSDRYGERAHASWGAEFDVMGAFLTQDAFDRFTLSKEEYELRKEREEKRDDDSDDDEEDSDEDEDEEGDEDGDDDDEDEDAPTVEFELEDLESRIIRLTIHSSDLGAYAMSPEGDKLFYLARFERGYDLWVHDFREESTKLLTKLNANGASMTLSDDGKTIYMLASGSLAKIDAASGERKPIAFRADLEIDGVAERQHLFDHVWRQVKAKFYRPDLHGVDWSYYYDQYQPKLAGLTNNRDFAVLLSEILGELNASHTGGRYFGGSDEGDANTASLGVFYDNDYDGPGVRIAEVLEGGPLDKAELAISAGDVITHIDGVEITDDVNLYHLLDGKNGKRTRLTIQSGGETTDKVVQPVSGGAENQLRYERWVKTRRELVDEISGGRLAYMHVRGMNDGSFRAFYAEVLGRHAEKEGLIVDTRFNGGGWLHDDLVTFLTGVNYVNLYPRDDESPDTWYFGEPARRWSKPSVVVMSESNYSDAHFFPWAYKAMDIGPTIGMPVPGTATAVWWERLHTGDIVFGIPQVGTKGADGVYLENLQLEPDYRVPLDPTSAAEGRDTQIIESVRVLLEMIDDG